MIFSSLQTLVNMLEHGTKLHISILFQKRLLPAQFFSLAFKSIIHSTVFCDEIKKNQKRFKACLKCKKLAVDKAMNGKKPFYGKCINGAYEYCYPVIIGGEVVCIIFIGNIMHNQDELQRKNPFIKNEHVFNTLEKAADEKLCTELAGVIESYIKLLIKNNDAILEHVSNDIIIDTIEEYIEYHFKNDISISQLASLYGYNEKYLGRVFKKQTGKSFNCYLNDIRLKYAAKLLCETNKNVTNISLDSGFNNVTYFNKRFKMAYSISPNEYRAVYCTNKLF